MPDGSQASFLARLLAEQPAAFLELLGIDLAPREAGFQDVEGGGRPAAAGAYDHARAIAKADAAIAFADAARLMAAR